MHTHAMHSARPRIAAMVATMHTNGFDTVCVMICYACECVCVRCPPTHLMAMTEHPGERLNLFGLHVERVFKDRVLDGLGGALKCRMRAQVELSVCTRRHIRVNTRASRNVLLRCRARVCRHTIEEKARVVTFRAHDEHHIILYYAHTQCVRKRPLFVSVSCDRL
jgi:hypothetical protein